MKNFLLISALFAAQATPAQDRFVNHDLEGYYDWFHEQSQVADHYEPNTTLYTFTASTQVHEGPCRDADVLTKLPLAFPVTNLSYDDPYFLPEDEINGYGDFWYHVTGRDDSGQPFQGYIWGADIAKSYYRTDLNKDQKPELVLLGISTQKRKNLRDINAEVRLVQEGQLMTASTIPGLCLFEDCAASPLLRVVHTPQGFPVIEASTMTVGCWPELKRLFIFTMVPASTGFTMLNTLPTTRLSARPLSSIKEPPLRFANTAMKAKIIHRSGSASPLKAILTGQKWLWKPRQMSV